MHDQISYGVPCTVEAQHVRVIVLVHRPAPVNSAQEMSFVEHKLHVLSAQHCPKFIELPVLDLDGGSEGRQLPCAPDKLFKLL